MDFERKKNSKKLKKKKTLATLIQYSDPHKPYQLKTDTSDLAIGAVLKIISSKDIRLWFKIKNIVKSEQNYLTHNKEMFAIFH